MLSCTQKYIQTLSFQNLLKMFTKLTSIWVSVCFARHDSSRVKYCCTVTEANVSLSLFEMCGLHWIIIKSSNERLKLITACLL